MYVDPENITDFNRSDYDLQLVLLFWICAAGKNAMTSAKALENLLQDLPCILPLDAILCANDLPFLLKKHGVGCYNNKAKTMVDLANKVKAGLDLRVCSVEELESIYGIGPKTARCFIIHSRRDARCAGLDTHILKFMYYQGYDVPKSTPSSRKRYLEIESEFIELARESGMSVAEFDLSIWKKYRDS